MPAAAPTVHPIVVFLMLSLMASVIGAWIWVILRVAFHLPVLPRFEPRIVPWGGKSVLLVLLVWVAVQIVGQVAFTMATHGVPRRAKGGPPVLTPSEMMVASAIQNTAILVIIPLLLAAISHAQARDFGLVKSARRMLNQVGQGVVAWPLSAPLIYAMMLLAVAIWGKQNHPLESAITNDGVSGMSALFLLAGAVLAPAAEELIFRGVLLGWLTRWALESNPISSEVADQDHAIGPDLDFRDDLNAQDDIELRIAPLPADGLEGSPNQGTSIRLILANLVVSILFAGLHYSVWPTPVPIFFLSLVLGVLYQRTGSLVGPVALHMTFNGISTVLMLLTIGLGAKVDVKPSSTPSTSIPIPAPVPKPIATVTSSWNLSQSIFFRS